MNKTLSIRFIATLILFNLFLFSCTDQVSNTVPTQKTDVVSIEKALNIAKGFTANSKSGRKEPKRIKNSKTISENNIPYLHIINFENNEGFAVVAADTREMPILAYSDKGSFAEGELPLGVQEWIEYRKAVIKKLRADNVAPLSTVTQQWQSFDVSLQNTVPIDSDGNPIEVNCTPVHVTRGPLMATTWGQGCGYNDLCPSIGGPCQKAPTGCVATAMAQVMRYHQYPLWFSWTAMPNTTGAPETARLMRDIGNKVAMQYNANGSGTDTKTRVVPALVNSYGYASTAQYLDYAGTANYERVKTELNSGRPVIFKGGEKQYWAGLIPYYTEGHAWVCDGYSSSYFPCEGYGTLYLRMNWGWSSSGDGWYAFNNFNPLGDSFNYKSGVIVGIRRP